MMIWITRKIAYVAIRRKKYFLLFLATSCVFYLLRGSKDLNREDELVGKEKQKGAANATEKSLGLDTNEDESKTYNRDENFKSGEKKESASYAKNEGEEVIEKDKEAGRSGEDNIGEEDQRDKVEAIKGGSSQKGNHERTKIEDKAHDVEYNKSVTDIPKHVQDIEFEKGDAKKSSIKESVFHVDQSNRYPSHDDDRIAYQVDVILKDLILLAFDNRGKLRQKRSLLRLLGT